MLKQFYLKTIQFSISTQFSSIWSIDMILSGATTPGQTGLRIVDNKWVLHILQSFPITEATPSDF